MKYDDDDAARPELGRRHRRARRLRLGSGDAVAGRAARRRSSASKRRCGRRRSRTCGDVEFMAFPRLPAVAEIALVAGESTHVGRLPARGWRAGAALVGAGRQLLPLAADRVAGDALETVVWLRELRRQLNRRNPPVCGSVDDAHRQPNTSGNISRPAQTEPEIEADDKPQEWPDDSGRGGRRCAAAAGCALVPDPRLATRSVTLTRMIRFRIRP